MGTAAIATAELSQLVSTLVSAASAAQSSESSAEVSRATGVLKQLRKVAVTAAQLKATEAGKKVNKLKKHPSQAIADAAVQVIEAWKNCVKQDSSSQPADDLLAPAQSSKPPSKAAAPAPAAKPSAKPATPAVKKTGDQTRDKIRSLIAEALVLAADSVEDADPAGVAAAVEDALYEQNGGVTAAYKSKYRSIGFNLKDPNNPDLRAKVLIGEIPPQVLVNMTSEEMASDARKMEIEKIRDHMKKECERGNTTQATTDQFQCGKCKQKKTTYFQMQTRSADEPMTTFVTCTVCGNKWKFC